MKTTSALKKPTRPERTPGLAKRGPASPAIDARVWLREHGYEDVAAMIDGVMSGWEESGVETRRSWWQVLAGGAGGRPFTIFGQEFPVLACAQRRQGVPVTPNAIERNPPETAPAIRRSNRWPARAAGHRQSRKS
jgi:hypothetical protein